MHVDVAKHWNALYENKVLLLNDYELDTLYDNILNYIETGVSEDCIECIILSVKLKQFQLHCS